MSLATASTTETRRTLSPIQEIWKWTMTPDAVATCFGRDVFEMRENLEGGADFYWLGRVPCRTVCLIGMVVGLQVFESRIVYSIDDGTAVIDCAHRVQRIPGTPSKKHDAVREMPKPVARIGLPIKVVGKVLRAYGTRQIQADKIEPCKSMNDEPLHWRKVRELHRTNYNLDEPFVIPSVAPTTASVRAPSPVASVDVKPDPTKSSLPRLRHFSRLHPRELTDNTFRIYVKAYMLNTPSIAVAPINELEAVDGAATSVKRPNPLTPRPAISQIGSAAGTAHHKAAYCRGFTLSYLRRVPELADMAQRVILAEGKRRQEKKHGERGSGGSAPRASSAATQDHPVGRVGAKMKRLFKWAIIQLLHEGSIVLWDGPVHVYDSGMGRETSGLWPKSFGTEGGNSGMSGGKPEEGEQPVSDPERDEEGYMPVTTALLGEYVKKVIRGGSRRVRKEEVLARLRLDDRWKFIGEWQVQEALEYLQQEGRAPANRTSGGIT